MRTTADALAQGLESIKLSYELGAGPAFPPDADSNGYPDHLGDAASGEPTFFDGVLEPPISASERWREWPAFPIAGILFAYYYDTDEDGAFDGLATEGLVYYNANTGVLVRSLPPAP